MCPDPRPAPDFGADLDRRSLLKVTGAAGATTPVLSALGAPAAGRQGPPRVYVLVVDGCKPGEITPALTPDAGGPAARRRLNYPRARRCR